MPQLTVTVPVISSQPIIGEENNVGTIRDRNCGTVKTSSPPLLSVQQNVKLDVSKSGAVEI